MIATTGVRVQGSGPLAPSLARRLREPLAAPADGGTRVLVAPVDGVGEALDRLLADDPEAPVLLVGTWRCWVYVGPLWRPGTAGCPRCLLARVTDSSIGPARAGHEALSPADGTLPGGPAVAGIVAALAAARLASNGDGDDALRVCVYDAHGGGVAVHRLVPDSTCATCGAPATSTLPAFTDAGTPLRKPSPGALRVRPLDFDALAAQVSPVGLFRRLRFDLQSPFGAASVELPEVHGRPREPAMGRAPSYAESRAVAVLEGLERHCGLHRGGRRTVVRAAYRDVAGQAVHPPSFGVHPASSYDAPGFGFRRFRDDVEVDWVEAYSFARGGPVLVPERAAFWGPRHDGEPTFFYETSNGCALGGCTEEAVLHGLRELVERDSFLLAWYRRLELPELELHGDPDPELRGLLRKSELFTGFTFRAFLSTMEHGMPSVWLAAVGRDPAGPAVLAGAAAHPDPRQAVVNGVYELAKRVLAIAHYYPERRAEALPMLQDPGRVRALEHHPTSNCLPEARHRFAFLLDRDGPRMPLGDVPGTLRRDGTDLRADLETAVDGMLRAGLDVLVVDQTMPEAARHGLACVKVLVPGLVPITFGHANRRTENLPRLADPSFLPYRSALPAGAEPEWLPHPFD